MRASYRVSFVSLNSDLYSASVSADHMKYITLYWAVFKWHSTVLLSSLKILLVSWSIKISIPQHFCFVWFLYS